MLKLIKNNAGATLVEVLVTAGMTAIISLGVATMMQNSMQEQRKLILLETLKSQKAKFEFLLRDQGAWTQTIGSAANNNSTSTGGPMIFEQIRATTNVSATGYATPVKIVLLDSAGTISADLLSPSGTSGNGFTEKGTNCSTFSTTVGNDACPISYRLLLGAECPASATACANPQLKIVARLLYNPTANSTLDKFSNLIGITAGTSIVDNATIPDGKYDAVVKRTSASVNRSFRIVAKYKPLAIASNCTNGGGAGRCSPRGTTGFLIHPVTALAVTADTGWNEDYDPNGLVNENIGALGDIRFTETGYYGCMISVPAFDTGGFTAKLINVSTGDVAAGSTTAGEWAQSTAVIDTKFNVTNTTHVYRIMQTCDAEPTGTPSAQGCALGMSPISGYGTGQVVVSMSCYKLDRSM